MDFAPRTSLVQFTFVLICVVITSDSSHTVAAGEFELLVEDSPASEVHSADVEHAYVAYCLDYRSWIDELILCASAGCAESFQMVQEAAVLINRSVPDACDMFGYDMLLSPGGAGTTPAMGPLEEAFIREAGTAATSLVSLPIPLRRWVRSTIGEEAIAEVGEPFAMGCVVEGNEKMAGLLAAAMSTRWSCAAVWRGGDPPLSGIFLAGHADLEGTCCKCDLRRFGFYAHPDELIELEPLVGARLSVLVAPESCACSGDCGADVEP